MDETGVMLSKLNSIMVRVGKGDLQGYRGAGVTRQRITAIECISGDDKHLPPVIIWPAIIDRSNWTTYHTPGWHHACSNTGHADSLISLQWLKLVFNPQTKERARQKPRILICDGSGRTRRSKSWGIALKTTSSFVAFFLIPPTSSNPVTSECLAHWRPRIASNLNVCIEVVHRQLPKSILHRSKLRRGVH